jgi:hypothetical protein
MLAFSSIFMTPSLLKGKTGFYFMKMCLELCRVSLLVIYSAKHDPCGSHNKGVSVSLCTITVRFKLAWKKVRRMIARLLTT